MDLNSSSKKPAAPPAPKPRAKLWGGLRLTPIIKDTINVTFLSIIGRSVGFVIPFAIAALYGIGGETDAFFSPMGSFFSLPPYFRAW